MKRTMQLAAGILALTLALTGFFVAEAGATAASADRNTLMKNNLDLKAYPVAASTTIYKGTMVAINTAGYAVPAADTASFLVVGIADAKADNASGSAGDISVKVRQGVALLNATAITQAMVGTVMYVVDDNTVDDSVGTNSIAAGVLVEYVSSTSGWVAFNAGTNPGIGKLAAGVGLGYRIARGTITLNGTGSAGVSTNLNSITACTISNRRVTTPGLDPVIFTHNVVSTSLWVYAWKFTSSGDATLIASTDNDDVLDWICVGF